MTITQLTYFRELAKNQNLTKTAQILHISQPSLSASLKSLESELGINLFDRKGKYLILNEQGRTFLKYVERALNSLDTATSILTSSAYHEETPVKISFTSMMGYTLIPQLLGNFYQIDEMKQIPIICTYHSVNKEVVSDLITGNADLIFSFSTQEAFSFVPILREELVFMVPTLNPLSRKPSLKITDVKDEPILVSSRDAHMYEYVKNMFAFYNLQPNAYISADNSNVRYVYVSLGNCIAIGSRLPFEIPNVTMVPIDHPMRYRQVYMCWDAQNITRQAECVKQYCISQIEHL